MTKNASHRSQELPQCDLLVALCRATRKPAGRIFQGSFNELFCSHFSFGAQARAILESARSGDKIPKSPPDESVFILCSCISVFAYFSLLKGKPRHNIGRAQLWLEAIRVERLAGNEGIAQQVKLTENLLY
jgi:hypothetical protein